MNYVGNTVRNMQIQDFSIACLCFVCACVCGCSFMGGIVDVLHAVSVASGWTNSAVIVAEPPSWATAETLKQHSQTSAMKRVCVCFKQHIMLCHHFLEAYLFPSFFSFLELKQLWIYGSVLKS